MSDDPNPCSQDYALIAIMYDQFTGKKAEHEDESQLVRNTVRSLRTIDSWWIKSAFDLQRKLSHPPFLIGFSVTTESKRVVLSTRCVSSKTSEDHIVANWPGGKKTNSSWPIHNHEQWQFVLEWTQFDWAEIRPSNFEFELFAPETKQLLINNLESWLDVGWFDRWPSKDGASAAAHTQTCATPGQISADREASYSVMKSQEIKSRYIVTPSQIRNWAKDDERSFIQPTEKKGYYLVDTSSIWWREKSDRKQ